MFCELMLAALLCCTVGQKLMEKLKEEHFKSNTVQELICGPIPKTKDDILAYINTLEYMLSNERAHIQYFWDKTIVPRLKEDIFSDETERRIMIYIKCRRGFNNGYARLILLKKELEKYEKQYTTNCGVAPSSDSTDNA